MFAHRQDGYWIDWREVGDPHLVARRPLPQWSATWIRDGRVMVAEPNPESGGDLVLLDPANRTSHYFLQTAANEGAPAGSPDGRWVGLASDQTGASEIYVVSSPTPGELYRGLLQWRDRPEVVAGTGRGCTTATADRSWKSRCQPRTASR